VRPPRDATRSFEEIGFTDGNGRGRRYEPLSPYRCNKYTIVHGTIIFFFEVFRP
jgi:hypothetical protein